MKKKFMIFLIGLIFCLGISSVKADSLSFSNYYDEFDDEIYLYLNNKSLIDDMISLYEQNQSDNYPYYFVNLSGNLITLTYSSSNETYWSIDLRPSLISGQYYSLISEGVIYDNGSYIPNFIASVSGSYRSGTIINHGFVYSNNPLTFDSILFPNFTSNDYDVTLSSFEIEEGDYLPGYVDLYNNTYHLNDNISYTEINLNNYSYIALSLKDYTVEQEFSTTMQVLGQYCLTPVYNYGLTERKDILTGSKVQGCSLYYENYTPVRTYVLKSDIENHAIYYLKAYDSTRDNKVKVDTSVFDIHYITLEDEDNPIISIGGHNYPAIPYDSLTDSSTISEAEGYVSGSVCAVGDFNCMSQFTGYNFSDIFNSPINFLKNLWTSITEVFKLVVMFISLLPVPIQYFFYISFMLAIIIGLIKIIL